MRTFYSIGFSFVNMFMTDKWLLRNTVINDMSITKINMKTKKNSHIRYHGQKAYTHDPKCMNVSMKWCEYIIYWYCYIGVLVYWLMVSFVYGFIFTTPSAPTISRPFFIAFSSIFFFFFFFCSFCAKMEFHNFYWKKIHMINWQWTN